jgi:hypothetical protein
MPHNQQGHWIVVYDDESFMPLLILVGKLARPPRFERGTLCLEGRCSIQLSYGRFKHTHVNGFYTGHKKSTRGRPTVSLRLIPMLGL